MSAKHYPPEVKQLLGDFAKILNQQILAGRNQIETLRALVDDFRALRDEARGLRDDMKDFLRELRELCVRKDGRSEFSHEGHEGGEGEIDLPADTEGRPGE